MSCAVKLTRDTLTGKETVYPPQPVPPGTESYKARRSHVTGAHCVETLLVCPSRREAELVFEREKRVIHYAELPFEELRAIVRNRLTHLHDYGIPQRTLSRVLGVKYDIAGELVRKHPSITGRQIAVLIAVADLLLDTCETAADHLPDPQLLGRPTRNKGNMALFTASPTWQAKQAAKKE